MFKRDRSEVMPGQMEKIMEAAIDTLKEPDGAGGDLESVDDEQYELSGHDDPFVEIHGNVDLPHLIRVVVAKWEEVRLP